MPEKGKSLPEKYADFTTPISLVAIGVGALWAGPVGAGLVAGGLADLATNEAIRSYGKQKQK